MTPMQYVRAYARFWYVILGCVALALGVSAVVDTRTAPEYEASTDLVIVSRSVPRNADASERSALLSRASTLAAQRVLNYQAAARGDALAEATLKRIRSGPIPGDLEGRLSVEVPTRSSYLIVSVRDTDPARTRVLATRAGEAMIGIVDTVERESTQGQPLLRARVSTPSQTPATLVRAQTRRNSAILLAAGLLVGLALAVALARLRPRLRDSRTVADWSGASLVVTLPTLRRGSGGSSSASARYRRALRELRTGIFFLREDSQTSLAVALTGAHPTSTIHDIASDLAAATVATKARTLLVDADLSGPSARRAGDSGAHEGSPGLADYLSGSVPFGGLITRDPAGFHTISAGAEVSDPADLLHHEAFDALMRGAAERYDYVLVVTPAASTGTGAPAVAARCDASVVVVGDRTTSSRLRSVLRLLETVEADVRGVVLTR